MIKVQSFFQNLINIPSANPEDFRRKRLLNILLLGVAILPTPLIPISLFFAGQFGFSDQDAQIIIGVAFAVILSSVIFYFVNRSVSGPLAAILFLLFLSLVLIFADDPKELANGRSLLLFTIPIMFSSVLLSPPSSFLFALLSSIEITLLAFNVDIIPNTPAMVTFFALALVSWLSSRSLQQALGDLRSTNANLDKLVQERTSDLADALLREKIDAGRREAILNSIADGVVVFDKNGKSLLANPAITNLLETSLAQIVGHDVNDLLKSEGVSAQDRGTLHAILEKPELARENFRMVWGKRTLSVNAARVNDSSGENIGVVAVFRDFTHEAEVERMKSTFVAMISHELRTPLNAILGYAEMFNESVLGVINDKQKGATERIISNTNRLLNIVSELLDQAQIEAGTLKIKIGSVKPVELMENVHSVMDQIVANAQLKLVSNIDPNLPEVISGDPQRLQQILINLINNSVKFTNEGEIRARLFLKDQTLWGMEVRDTGMGIPEEEIPHIFDTFHQADSTPTRQHGGIGLGLAIVKQLVDLMHGEISVTSEPGKGSSFTIILPLQALEKQEETIYE
jgi:PAS domain S-box-containing protein